MIYIILLILGLCLGSFINALVWRLHEEDTKTKKTNNLSIWNGRSICPKCHRQLAARDLVPVFSWLSLKGKCRYCHKPISVQYPLVEVLTATVFIFSYVFWPVDFNSNQQILFGFWLLLTTGLLALAVYDLKWFLLPNSIVYPLIALALIQTVFLMVISTNPGQIFITTLWGLLIGGGIFYLIYKLSKHKWIGGGDVSLGILLGMLVGGPASSLLLIFLASLIGSLIALPLLLSGRAKRDTHLPFGPFLIAAAFIVTLFGASIIDWYRSLLLL